MITKVVGYIRWYSQDKHYGYIVRKDTNQEVFFHINDCRGFDPKIDNEISFEIGSDSKGRIKALQIRPISEGVSVSYENDKS